MEIPITKSNKWSLVLLPETTNPSSYIKVAASFETHPGMSVIEVAEKIRVAVSGCGFKQVIELQRPRQGICSPIQIQEVPQPADPIWEIIPAIHHSKLFSLAVFSTQREFSNLIGVPVNTVSQALYNARRNNDKGGIATVKGFKIARLEDIASR